MSATAMAQKASPCPRAVEFVAEDLFDVLGEFAAARVGLVHGFCIAAVFALEFAVALEPVGVQIARF